ncbi:SusC/RagA family TonB-linked outer membrane protein [Spirosoma soli]|uniref:SusC/RagA family TonB-linked outer membrane protein n=1 Tax=Spirosoma soli TaxID=1770529 RepID=A0ABW5M086_9BACT
MTKLIYYSCLWLLLLVGRVVVGQSITVSGRVTSDAGREALPGVNVSVEGTTTGTTTAADGTYRISIPSASATIVFSYIGYITQRMKPGGRTQLDVTLEEDNKSLNEVVVVGYGTKDRRDVTTAISSVSGKDIQNLPVASPVALLQGRTAGVQIVNNTGAPGASNLTIRVRGATSINAGNNPLFIVDGLPFEGGTSDINPNDIESIEVLKDAAASAIYGSRAANGVVLITTKRGKSGKASINFNYYKGIQQVDRTRLPKLMNSTEFIELIQEQRANGAGVTSLYAFVLPENGIIGGNGRISDTNWLDEVIQTGAMDNYEIAVQGGENKLKFYLSGALLNQKGALVFTDYKRYTGKLNLDYQASNKLKLGTSINFTRGLTNGTPENEGGTFQAALFKAPVNPVRAIDGTYFLEDISGILNPVAVPDLETRLKTKTRLLANAFAEFTILPGLNFKTSWGTDLVYERDDFFQPSTSRRGTVANGSTNTEDDVNWIYEHTLNYATFFGQHRLTALLGYSQLENTRSSTFMAARDYGTNSIETLNAASTPTAATSSKRTNGLSSLFGRVGYIYANKYYLEASLRQDGSSKFGANNRYALFPAASIGWQVGREAFFENLAKSINDFKIRASYGRTGNQGGIGEYTSQGAFATGQGYVGQNGVGPTAIANPDLKWETTDQFNLGADISFLKSRVSFSADVYLKRTSNLLLNVQLPSTSGFGSALQNVGNTENRGVELSLNTINVDGPALRWTSNFNISFNKNKIIKLYNGTDIINTRGGTGFGQARTFNLLREGQAIGAFFGWEANGIYATSAENERQLRADNATGYIFRGGDMRFVDQNGDNIIDDRDRVVIGNALPRFTGGFTNNLQYKNFQLDVLAQFTYGNDVYNGTRTVSESMFQFANAAKIIRNRWRKEGDVTDIPRADHTDPGGNRRTSTRWLEDGSYLRIKTVTLAYNVPSALLQKIRVSNLRLYATAQNLFTFTRYTGIDPEANSYGGSGGVTDLGFDYAAYPQYKTFLFGVNLGF